ncbi:MAG: hypothetical protein U0984_17885 [Prosthecobacter sp.]|nr:hypothetical protein [Prosthecobacter sp.]
MNTCFPPLDDGCPSSPSAPPPLTDHSLPSTATHALDNPRHEAFAFALAAGESVAGAYDAAGFHPKNRKARSEALSQQPDIVAPVKHLVETVPNLIDLWRSHAPSFGTMPETPRKMNAWLWQVLTGRRKVQPLQMQAARLFVRMNHWDRRPKKGEDAPTAPPLVLVSGPVAQSLDLINAVNLAHEVHFNLLPPRIRIRKRRRERSPPVPGRSPGRLNHRRRPVPVGSPRPDQRSPRHPHVDKWGSQSPFPIH